MKYFRATHNKARELGKGKSVRLYILHKLYDCFGGHQSISLVSELLEYSEPDFGSAIEEMEITIHFNHDGPAKKSLEQLHKKFHDNLKNLPKCTFYRKKKRLVLDIEGTFTTGYEMERNKESPIKINPDWVKATLNEIADNLTLIKSKIKRSDDFSFSKFEAHLLKTLNEMPTDIDELERLREVVRERRKTSFEKLDDWEKLGIDWDNYHPAAREVVPVPDLWSSSDEFSPNGNDTGADTLGIFRDWNKRNQSTSALIFLKNLLRGWEIDINNPYESEYSSHTYFQSVVGLAFASARFRGECEQAIKDKASLAINDYLDRIAGETKWQHKDECEEKLKTALEVIGKMPNKALQPING